MKILDPDERGVGEIIVKGPMVMQGYYKMRKRLKRYLQKTDISRLVT